MKNRVIELDVDNVESQLMKAFDTKVRSEKIRVLTKYVEAVGNQLTTASKKGKAVVLYSKKQIAGLLGVSQEFVWSHRGWFVDPRTIKVAAFAPSFVNKLAFDHNVPEVPNEELNNPLQYYMGHEKGIAGYLPHEGVIVYRNKNGAIFGAVKGFNEAKGDGLIDNGDGQVEEARKHNLLDSKTLSLLSAPKKKEAA